MDESTQTESAAQAEAIAVTPAELVLLESMLPSIIAAMIQAEEQE